MIPKKFQKRNCLFAIVLVWSMTFVPTSACPDCCEEYTEDYECPPETKSIDDRVSDLYEDIECTSNIVETTLKLLEAGDLEIELTSSGEAIMLIGDTGTGKTTLTYFLAGDNARMIAYEKATDWYLIKDCNGKIGSGGSTIVSATIFPDLVVEPKENTSYYDNPGFMDTRSVCIEIANAYFMKKVANHLTKLKFGFVINYNSIKPGMSRDDFTGMLKHIIAFVPNIEKYGEGIALVGTKLQGIKPEDDPYIQDAINFMIESRPFLDQVFVGTELRKAEFIIDSLTVKDGGKVGVFRVPDECGPLSGIESMQNNKANLSQIFVKNLNYVESSPSDFNFSLSAEAKITVLDISRDLSTKTVDLVTKFAEALNAFVNSQFDCLDSSCESIIQNLSAFFANPDFISNYADSELWLGLTFTEIQSRLTNPQFLPLGFEIPPEILAEFQRNCGYLEFLQDFVNVEVNILNWLQPMKDLKMKVAENVHFLATQLDDDVTKNVKELSEELSENFAAELKRLTTILLDQGVTMAGFSNLVENLLSSSYNLCSNVEGLQPTEYLQEIFETVDKFGNNSGTGFLDEMWSHGIVLDFLQEISTAVPISFHQKNWVESLLNLKVAVFERISKYFVREIYDFVFGLVESDMKDLMERIEIQVSSTHDVEQIRELLGVYKGKVGELKGQVGTMLGVEETRMKEFVLYVREYLAGLGQNRGNLSGDDVAEDGPILLFEVLEFVEMVGDFPWIHGYDWMKGFEEVEKFVGNKEYWNDFLIELLNKVEEHETSLKKLRDNPVPIGFVYTQLPSQPDPLVIWPGVTWTDVTSNYAGKFFRAEGGDSASFGSDQGSNTNRLTGVYYEQETFNCRYRDCGEFFDTYVGVSAGGTSSRLIGGFYQLLESGKDYDVEFLKFETSGGEVRPVNTAVRMWKRTS